MCDRCRELDVDLPDGVEPKYDTEPPTFTFQLTYFKESGKFEYKGELEIPEPVVAGQTGFPVMWRVADVIKEHVKEGDLPGLQPGIQWEGWIHTDHEDGHPVLVDTTDLLD